jgi:hypothetical protein
VGKKELADSGLSLRDFLNKEKGLTRKGSYDPTAGEGRDKDEQAKADAMGDDSPMPVAKPTPKATLPERIEVTGKRQPKDDETKSLSERMKASRERARTSSTGTDTRSVGERIRSSLGMAKGGKIKKFAKGGSIDGIAQRGKTKGRIC